MWLVSRFPRSDLQTLTKVLSLLCNCHSCGEYWFNHESLSFGVLAWVALSLRRSYTNSKWSPHDGGGPCWLVELCLTLTEFSSTTAFAAPTPKP